MPISFIFYSKRMQVAGYYHAHKDSLTTPYRVYNTWMGDPAKLLLLEATLQVMKSEKLVEATVTTGKFFKAGLFTLEKDFPGLIENIRGNGMLLAFDFKTAEIRDKFVGVAKNLGLHCGVCLIFRRFFLWIDAF